MAIQNNLFNFLKDYKTANFIDYKNNEYNIYLDILNYVISHNGKIQSDKVYDRLDKLKTISELLSYYVKVEHDGDIKTMSFEADKSFEYENLRIKLEKIFFEVALKDSWSKFVHDNKQLGLNEKEIAKKAEDIHTKTITLLQIVKPTTEDYISKTNCYRYESDVAEKIRRVVFDILISEDRKDAGEKFRRLEAIYNILNTYFVYGFPYYQAKTELPRELKKSIDNKYNACKQKDDVRDATINLRVETIKEYITQNGEISEKALEKIQNKSLAELKADKEKQLKEQQLKEAVKKEAIEKKQGDLQENLIEYLNNDAK